MAHEIFGTRFLGVRTPAWHRLGTVLSEEDARDLSVADALAIAGLNYQVESVPVRYEAPDGINYTSPDRVVLVREPTFDDPRWRDLGVVSTEYRYLQNSELARGLDVIARNTGWRLETMGALHQGGTVFMTLNCGPRSVFGDKYVQHLIVSDGKAQARALQISVAEERVVCANTLAIADATALHKITINHTGDVAGNYTFWLDMISDLQAQHERAFADLETMASVKIGDDVARGIIDSALRAPKLPKSQQRAMQLLNMPGLSGENRERALAKLGGVSNANAAKLLLERREAAMYLYKRFNAGTEQGAKANGGMDPETLSIVSHTPYAALQAVTELVDWTGRTNATIAAASSLFGDGAQIKARAFRAALAATKA